MIGATTIASADTEVSAIAHPNHSAEAYNWYSHGRRALVTVYLEDDDSDRRPPRRHYEEPLGIKLRKQFLAIADSVGAVRFQAGSLLMHVQPLRNPEDDIANIARIACDNYDDEQVRNGFLDLAVKLYASLSLKAPSRVR